jgi:hypothetical protein
MRAGGSSRRKLPGKQHMPRQPVKGKGKLGPRANHKAFQKKISYIISLWLINPTMSLLFFIQLWTDCKSHRYFMKPLMP